MSAECLAPQQELTAILPVVTLAPISSDGSLCSDLRRLPPAAVLTMSGAFLSSRA